MQIDRSPGFSTALRAVTTAALLVGAASEADSAPVLDQSSPFVSGFIQFDQQARAQLFTVGADGSLEAVELDAAQLSPVGNLLVSIEETVGGAPALPGAGTLLTSGSLPLAALPSSAAGGTGPAFVRIPLDPPVDVFAGETLALVVRADAIGPNGAGLLVWAGNPGSYVGGDAWRYEPGGFSLCVAGPPCEPGNVPPSWKRQGAPDPFDFAFRTYLPEPSPASMSTAGIAAIAALAVRRRRSTRRSPEAATPTSS